MVSDDFGTSASSLRSYHRQETFSFAFFNWAQADRILWKKALENMQECRYRRKHLQAYLEEMAVDYDNFAWEETLVEK